MKLFGTSQSRRLSDPGFIVCVLWVPKLKSDVIPGLLHIKARVSVEYDAPGQDNSPPTGSGYR